MSNHTKICNNCGATCEINASYCRNCSQDFPKVSIDDEQIIDAIPNNELKEFIGKNSDYYFKKFSKIKDSKLNLQLNFSALFFGPIWFFYRKMYKEAILFATILILMSSFLSIIIPTVFKSDIDAYYTSKDVYANYVNSDKELYIFGENAYDMTIHPEYEKIENDLIASQNKIRLIDFLINAPVFAFNIIFRLLANSLYKKHVIKCISTLDGGTSIKSAIIATFLLDIIYFIIPILLLQIPVFSDFHNATRNLFNWL